MQLFAVFFLHFVSKMSKSREKEEIIAFFLLNRFANFNFLRNFAKDKR